MISNTLYQEKGAGKKGAGMCYTLRTGPKLTLRFLADPTSGAGDAWFGYREVDAWNGLKGGVQMPAGLKRFPGIDGKDPLLRRVRLTDEQVAQGWKTPAQPQKVITSVVYESGDIVSNQDYMPTPGTVILFSMSKQWFDQVCVRIAEKREELGDDWSPIGPGKLWAIRLTGEFGKGYSLSVAVREDAPPVDLPEPLDPRGWVVSKRMAAEDFIEGQPDPDWVEEQVDAQVERLSRVAASGVAESMVDDDASWDTLATSTIKDALKAARVPFSPRADRAELVDLAKKSL